MDQTHGYLGGNIGLINLYFFIQFFFIPRKTPGTPASLLYTSYNIAIVF